MRVKILSFILLSLLLLTACRDPIDLNFGVDQRKLVVDGFITNLAQQHSIKVSYSSGFTNDGFFEPDPVTNALVEIEDDLGQSTSLTHTGSGEYLTPAFQAQPDRSYKVKVTLEGERYESTFQRLPTFTSTADISFQPAEREVLSSQFVVDQAGIGIYANLEAVNEPVYYQWLQRHYYVFESPFYLSISPIGNRFCFVRDFDRVQVDVAQSIAGSSEATVEIDFVLTSGKMWHEYGIEVIQLTTNAESFNYWDQIQRQSENVGSLFDPAPATIVGNIRNSSGEPALGFFGVYNQSTDYVFFNNCELALEFRRNLGPCPAEESPAARLTSHCYDCIYTPGVSAQTEQPSWWREIIPALDAIDREVCPGNF